MSNIENGINEESYDDTLETKKVYTKYEEYPRSNFPEEIDNWDNMQDINAITAPVAQQYYNLINANNFSGAASLLASNPDLLKTLFNADKYNQLSDGVKATQKFFKEQVETYVDELFANTVGINDNATGEEQKTNAYSISKINELLNNIERVVTVNFTAEGWVGEEAPYTQTVEVEGLKSTDRPLLVKAKDSSLDAVNAKAYNKAFGFISDGAGETGDGTLTWTVYKKPTIDIKIGLKGFYTIKSDFIKAVFSNMTFGGSLPESGEYFGLIDGNVEVTNDNTVKSQFLGMIDNKEGE